MGEKREQVISDSSTVALLPLAAVREANVLGGEGHQWVVSLKIGHNLRLVLASYLDGRADRAPDSIFGSVSTVIHDRHTSMAITISRQVIESHIQK